MSEIHTSVLKTSFILLLFSLFAKSSFASTGLSKNMTEPCSILISISFYAEVNKYPEDTILNTTTNDLNLTNHHTEFIIPDRWINETFEFQVNSEIIYYSFDNFQVAESKKLFLQALMKEKGLLQLNKLTDSLRHEYIQAQDDRKSKISGLILENEKQSIILNQDIPELYQKARISEAEYWKNASPELISDFQEKIRIYLDSIKSKSMLDELKKSVSESKSDTLILYQPTTKTKEISAVASSGINYKIQIAAFKSKLPDSAEKAIKKLSLLRKVETYTDEKGVKIYTTGNLKTWAEAVTLQKQVKQEGIRNPSIAAYENNIRIPVNDARRKNNEL
ncbi:MAG: SPOR domain-containing protein [Prolixibacteraceae bacterium]